MLSRVRSLVLRLLVGLVALLLVWCILILCLLLMVLMMSSIVAKLRRRPVLFIGLTLLFVKNLLIVAIFK